jgi:transcriptional regulator with XRE-family HTH domain
MLSLAMTDYPHKNAHHPVYISEWRKECRMTAQQLADAAGLTRSLLSQLETGSKRVNIDHLISVSRVLGCHPADLLRPPKDKFNKLSALYEKIPDDEKDKALKFLSAFSEETVEST